MNMIPSVAYREAGDGDQAFIMDSWLRSCKHSRYVGPIPMDEYTATMSKWVGNILKRDGVQLILAVNPEFEDQIFGFICVERGFRFPVVHYCYVKQPYRKLGIARGLFEASNISLDGEFQFTFNCRDMDHSQNRKGKFPNAKWTPLYARFPKAETVLLEERNHAPD